ncbi:membrane-associated protease RseP (regulator of RpoE activity) [Ancylobacter sp. 3268]|uniref:hypothetical protein n=1 Tax=Ancylobacter sp. 3268 TaxID=2817752 RepID=UPI0028556AE6|nr:hypothetical protein [Ancylobacter sp. 3268]MDR6954445.1 membrane-associated protease RseP (regulator of RpoE activity) [Ancylobacter sp. 3268]
MTIQTLTTAPTPRVPLPIVPVGQPIANTASADDDRAGPTTLLPGWRLLAADGTSVSEADELGRLILAAPARSLGDIAAKHEALIHAIGEELPLEYRVLLEQMGDELRQMG